MKFISLLNICNKNLFHFLFSLFLVVALHLLYVSSVSFAGTFLKMYLFFFSLVLRILYRYLFTLIALSMIPLLRPIPAHNQKTDEKKTSSRTNDENERFLLHFLVFLFFLILRFSVPHSLRYKRNDTFLSTFFIKMNE